MSVQATSWVWDHSKAQGVGLLVMLAIADAANKEGAASMQSVPTIAKMARTSPRHVSRCIAALLEMGELEKTGTSARYSTSVYRLPGMGTDPVYPTPDTMSGGPDDTPDAQVTPPLTSETSTPDPQVTQPQRTPQVTNPSPSAGDVEVPDVPSPAGDEQEKPGPVQPNENIPDLFEEWWAHWPVKVSKGAAQKAFTTALNKKAEYPVIKAGLVAAILEWRQTGKLVKKGDRWVAADPSHFPHASTWLNAERWADEHPDLGVQVGTDHENGGDSWMRRTPENTI